MADRQDPPMGAIFLEALQGSNGVQFYRREFLLAVRALADRKGLPIIADEVLTCGGRTGKFFAYELYEGFTPDFVVFGKGLQTSGIAEVRRPGRAYSQTIGEWDLGTTTAGGDATRFLKGAQVMKRIREGGLMENATKVGAYLVEKLREVQKFHGVTPDVSGAGFIIGMSHLEGAQAEVSPIVMLKRRDRYLPPLTLSKADVDDVITALKKPLPNVHLLRAKRDVAEMRAELNDTTDPNRRRWLESNIANFDAWIAEREKAKTQ
jgi:acetylornithine/N-succinyldiaminopimelate aminotransferase